VTRIDHGVVSQVAELRAHERQAAEESEQWKTRVEERKVIDASLVAIKPAARHGEPAQVFPARAAAPGGRPRLADGVITLAMLMTTAELEELEKSAGAGAEKKALESSA
jgi:hypothetical protein